MYSDKQPLGTSTNGGTPGESTPSSIKGALGFEGFKGQIPSTENCDPNLGLSQGGGPPRKAKSPMSLEKSCKGTRNDNVSQPPTPEGGVPRSMSEAGSGLEEQSKEVTNRPAKSIPSPTKVSGSPQQHSHGHRQHFCRSPRCASNNPDYATPSQTAPRQYLISKRHLVPGAICTRDPAALSNHSQQSITPQASPSPTTRPPKPVRKIENGMRQPSFASVSEAKSSPPADMYPPTRIPKPPSARSPLQCGNSSNESPRHIVSNGTLLPSYREVVDRSASNEFHDTPMPAGAAAAEDRVQDLPRVNSDLSCSVLVASTSSRESEVGEISDGFTENGRLGSSNCSAANAELELSTLEKMYLPIIKDFSGSLRSSQCSSVSGGSSALRSSTELEKVTERLAQNLGLNREANAEDYIDERESVDGLSSANLDVQTKDEDKDTARDLAPDATQIESETFCEFSFEKEKDNISPELHSRSTPSAERDDDINPEFRRYEPSVSDAQTSEEPVNKMSGLIDNFQSKEGCEVGKDSKIRTEVPVSSPSQANLEEGERHCGTSVANFVSTFENSHPQEPGWQRGTTKFVRGKGRQLWRSDIRDSREVVFLKPTSPRDRDVGDWTVDGKLEGAISKLNPSGQGRVRVLVEAFESLMNVGETEGPEKRASRVWCLNRMEKGEVDEDGEEFEEGDQRVDCYEVSGDGLQLRASMRLSLGGSSRLPVCDPDDDASEIEMSAIEKVEDWDDDCGRSAASGNIDTSSFKDMNREYGRSHSLIDREGIVDQDECTREKCDDPEFKLEGHQRSAYFEHRGERHFDDLSYTSSDRFSEDVESAKNSILQFGCYSGYDFKQKIDELDMEYRFKASRRRRSWKPTRVKPVSVSPSPSSETSAEKPRRAIRGTSLEPFRLMTEERGVVKEYQFARMLEETFMEEERLRNPIAQGLPWTTDEPEIVPKPPVKEQTRTVEFQHYSNSRAVERAEFDNYLSERTAYIEMQKQEQERLQQFIEQEEVKRLRREMVPRAQLMPYFDQPFVPTRSSKRLTVPKEPAFHNRKPKRAKCVIWQDRHHNQQQHQH